MKEKYQYKAIEGLVTTIEEKKCGEKHLLVTARVRTDDGKVWVCQFWNEVGNRLLVKNLLNQKIYLEGGIKEENVISVKFFDVKERTGPIPQYEDPKESNAKYMEALERNNMIIIDHEREGDVKKWPETKMNCLKVNGKWESKIEYVLRCTSGEQVMEHLRQFKADGSPGGVVVNPSLYKIKLQEMVDHCQETNGDYIEYFTEVSA